MGDANDKYELGVMYNLGTRYEQSLGVRQNYAEALKRWRSDADYPKAAKWYRLAADQGDGANLKFSKRVSGLQHNYLFMRK